MIPLLFRRSCFTPILRTSYNNVTARHNNLIGLFRQVADHQPEKMLFKEPEQNQLWSYGQFWTLVDQYSHCLHKMDLNHGDRLLAQVDKSIPNLALYMATLQIGAIYVPLNTDYTPSELEYFVENSEPKILVHSKKMDKNLGHAKVLSDTDLYENALSSRAKTHFSVVSSHHTALLCYTSGTTGRPKGAMLTHGNLSSNGRVLTQEWRFHSDDVLLHALPLYHVHGLIVAINTVFFSGASCIFLPRFNMDSVLDSLPHATVMMGVPTYYSRLLENEKFDSNLLKKVRLLVSGSAPMSADLWNKFKQRSGVEILERYGMTEGLMITSNPYEGARKPGTVGKALPDIEVRIHDGMLEYKGPNLFSGYFRISADSDFTEDGFFKSGDLAEYDSDGYIRILGREKDLVISGGLNIYPKQIEDVIDDHPLVAESAVVGIAHPDFGEALVAEVVPDGKLDSEELTAYIKSKLAGFKVPKRIYLVDEIPRNAMGKVSKVEIRKRYAHVFAGTMF